MTNVKNLDTAPINSLFFQYYVPALTSLLSITLHQIINTLILAHRVGKEGVTAVGLFGPVFTIYIAFALALMIGGGILVSRSIGAKNYGKAQEVFQFTTTVALIFSLVFAVNSSWLSAFISKFLGGQENETIVANTFDYIFWAFIWMPFFLLRMLWGNLISNDNAPEISRNASLIAVGLNILLDIVLVVIFPFGVAGASIATGISILVSLLYLYFYLRRATGNLSVRNFRFTLILPEWKQLFSFGFPTFLSEISFAVGLIMINTSLIVYGEMAIVAFGIINHLSFVFLRLFTAAMLSILPIISFNIGAQLPERVLQTVRFSLIFTTILGIGVSAIGFIFSDSLVSLFSGSESLQFKQLAGKAIGLYFILFIAAGPNYILAAYLQTIQKYFLSSLLHVLKGAAFVAFFILMLPGQFAMGLNGIWLSRSFAEIGTLLVIGTTTLLMRKTYYGYDVILRR